MRKEREGCTYVKGKEILRGKMKNYKERGMEKERVEGKEER